MSDVKVIPSWTEPGERACLEQLAKEVPAKGLIVEIGALYGGTTQVLAQANPKAKVTSIDDFSWTPEGYPTASKQLLEEHLAELGIKNVTVLAEKSEEIGPTWQKHIDLCFIDGGHSYKYVFADLVNFSVWSEVIALHDYNNPCWATIKQAIDDFLTHHPEWELDDVVGTVAVLRKK